MKLIPYVVKQGDFLGRLAARFGFDADATWNDAKNDALRKTGRTPNILHPGDVLYIPETPPDFVSVKTGTTNEYTAQVPRVSLTLTFRDAGGAALANAKVEYRGLPPASDPKDRPESTDGSGTIVVLVPMGVETFVVELPDKGVVREVRVGHMDPITEPSGQAKRLQHLGYGMSPLIALGERMGLLHPRGPECPEYLRLQLLAFQLDHGLEPGGVATAETCDQIVTKHGS
jgi:hypothetical protein